MVCPDDGAVDPARPPRLRSRASRRTRRSQPIADTAGRRCSTCRIHRAGVAIVSAIARPCAPSTSCLRNTVDCPEQDGSRALVQQAKADRSVPTLHPLHRSVRPRLPPKGSLESKSDSTVNLCPRTLAGWLFPDRMKNGLSMDTGPWHRTEDTMPL